MDRVNRHRKRLAILIAEAGTQGMLAEKVGTAESYISQLLTLRRGIARKFCVRLEQATGKPDGWMDQWLPEETESPAATPLSSADMWREPKMPKGEISKPEVEVLNLWRLLPDKLKMVAYSQMQALMAAKEEASTANTTKSRSTKSAKSSAW